MSAEEELTKAVGALTAALHETLRIPGHSESGSPAHTARERIFRAINYVKEAKHQLHEHSSRKE